MIALGIFIPKKQRKPMNDPFVERIARTRTNKVKKVSVGMVETRKQKTPEGQKAILEVEIHPDSVPAKNRMGHGTEWNRNRRWQVNLLQ